MPLSHSSMVNIFLIIVSSLYSVCVCVKIFLKFQYLNSLKNLFLSFSLWFKLLLYHESNKIIFSVSLRKNCKTNFCIKNNDHWLIEKMKIVSYHKNYIYTNSYCIYKRRINFIFQELLFGNLNNIFIKIILHLTLLATFHLSLFLKN